MLSLTLINSGAAFTEPRPEIARLLRELADKIERGENPMTLRDLNGNTCGIVSLDEDEMESADVAR